MRVLAVFAMLVVTACLAIACRGGDSDDMRANGGSGLVVSIDVTPPCGARVGAPSSEPVTNPVANASALDLASRLKIARDAVVIESAVPILWCDSCLGIHFAGAGCLLAITPGYLVALRAADKTYEYRTSRQGPGIAIDFLKKSDDFAYDE